MDEQYNKHYIHINNKNYIIDGWSDGPQSNKDTSQAICINTQGSYQFQLLPGEEENPSLYDFETMIPLYEWDGEKVVKRDIQQEKEEYHIRQDCLNKITSLKNKLAATDYQAIKFAEGWINEEEYASIRAQRQILRDQINTLEELI